MKSGSGPACGLGGARASSFGGRSRSVATSSTSPVFVRNSSSNSMADSTRRTIMPQGMRGAMPGCEARALSFSGPGTMRSMTISTPSSTAFARLSMPSARSFPGQGKVARRAGRGETRQRSGAALPSPTPSGKEASKVLPLDGEGGPRRSLGSDRVKRAAFRHQPPLTHSVWPLRAQPPRPSRARTSRAPAQTGP